jgi:hypothetical protein
LSNSLLGKVSAFIELNESWGGGFGSWGFSSGGGISWGSSFGGWLGGISLGLSFSFGGIGHNLLDWCWCFDVEVGLIDNVVWHVSNPCLPWGI